MYMKKYVAIILVLLFAICGCSQFQGETITKTFGIKNSYSVLIVEDAIDVILSDVAEQITVTAGENVMPNVVVEAAGGVLKIFYKNGAGRFASKIAVTLPVNTNLSEINLSGASSISSESALRNSSVAVKLSGASEFSGNVETGLLDLDISGASTVAIEGSATKLVMNLSDASEVSKKVSGNRYALACDECDVTMSGASDAYIHCNGKINILSLSGASDLHYTGNALITLTGNSVSGGSDIVQDTL
jgi:hypothetical protein